MSDAFVPFDQFRSNPQKIGQIPLTKVARELIWESHIGSIGQWYFSKEELDLLSLYVREGVTNKFHECCLIEDSGIFASRGRHYFKEYSKRYGGKLYFAFVEDLLNLLQKSCDAVFEEEDRKLQLKVLATVTEELLNHLGWGLYLAYQAGGIRNGFKVRTLTPLEIETIQQALLETALLYCQLFTREQPKTGQACQSIRQRLAIRESFSFIANLAGKGSRDANGSFFRLRVGCHELQNLVHGLKIRDLVQKHEWPITAVVAPFYASLSAAALTHAALASDSPKCQFLVHVYSIYEDHIRCQDWEGKTQREIIERLSHVPPLVRPDYDVSGQNIMIVSHALAEGKVLRGLYHYYRTMNADKIYLSAVEGKSDQLHSDDETMMFGDLPIAIPPTFLYTGPSDLRHWQKQVVTIVKRK